MLLKGVNHHFSCLSFEIFKIQVEFFFLKKNLAFLQLILIGAYWPNISLHRIKQ